MIGIAQRDDRIEAARAADGGVNFCEMVGRAHHHHSLAAVKTIQGIQNCSYDVIRPGGVVILCPISAAEAVELVEKQNRRSLRCRLRE